MNKPDPIFQGSAQAIGAAKGNVWRAALPKGQADAKRVEAFRAILEKVAPEWLLEAESFAQDGLLEYLDFQCRRPEPEPDTLRDANCSTLLALGGKARGGRPLLLKIRDEAPNPQVMFRQKMDAHHSVLAGTNIGNMGFAQMANSAGLVGGNNTGGPILDNNPEPGLNDCLVLRLIAERCATCREALRLVEQLAADRHLGLAGYARGMIFLLADAGREGMIIECTRTEVYARTFTDGVFLRTNHYCFPELENHGDRTRFAEASMQSSFERYARMESLAAKKDPLSAQDLMEISRDQEGAYPLCQTQSRFPWKTVSSWVHEIGDSTVTTHACNVAPTLGEYEALA